MGFGNGHLLLAICNHLTLLSKFLDGMYVSLLSDLPLHFLYVVQVQGWGWGSKARRGLVGDSGERGEGGHGCQGTHVGQGSCHGSCSHACHSSAHGDI